MQWKTKSNNNAFEWRNRGIAFRRMCIPRKYKSREGHSMVIPRERVAELFKYHAIENTLGVIQLNCSGRWESSVENGRIFNGFPAF